MSAAASSSSSYGKRRRSVSGGASKRRKPTAMVSVPRVYVRGLKPELKRHNYPAFFSQQHLASPSVGVSQYSFCTQITQGVSGSQRIGDQIFAKRLTVRGNISQNQTSVFERAVIAFVLDAQPAAGAPAFTDVFVGGLSLDTDYFNPILNDDKRRRFRLLKLMRWPLMWQAAVQAVGGASILASPQSFPWEVSIPINKKVSYNETAANPYQGCEIIMYAWSDSTSNEPFLDASGFLSFTDV